MTCWRQHGRARHDRGITQLPREHRKELWDGIKEQIQRQRFQVVRAEDESNLVRKLRNLLGDFVDLLYFGVEQPGKSEAARALGQPAWQVPRNCKRKCI